MDPDRREARKRIVSSLFGDQAASETNSVTRFGTIKD
jgi:hypothetical protein